MNSLYRIYATKDENLDALQDTLISFEEADDSDKLASTVESILSFGISYYYSVLEDPSIWQSEIAPWSPAEEEQDKGKALEIEKVIEE